MGRSPMNQHPHSRCYAFSNIHSCHLAILFTYSTTFTSKKCFKLVDIWQNQLEEAVSGRKGLSFSAIIGTARSTKQSAAIYHTFFKPQHVTHLTKFLLILSVHFTARLIFYREHSVSWHDRPQSRFYVSAGTNSKQCKILGNGYRI
jgi:hypothetical protein